MKTTNPGVEFAERVAAARALAIETTAHGLPEGEAQRGMERALESSPLRARVRIRRYQYS
jgi:hypothetical protein